MARGWESKSVEDQIAAAEAGRTAGVGRDLTPAEREHHARRAALALCRARIRQDLETARDPRYRSLLERSLVDVERDLDKLG
jgi:hypothetical protein